MNGREWKVYNQVTNELGVTYTELYDTVYFGKNDSEEWVYDSLVNHDGYPSTITLKGEGFEICEACDGVVDWEMDKVCPHCEYDPNEEPCIYCGKIVKWSLQENPLCPHCHKDPAEDACKNCDQEVQWSIHKNCPKCGQSYEDNYRSWIISP